MISFQSENKIEFRFRDQQPKTPASDLKFPNGDDKGAFIRDFDWLLFQLRETGFYESTPVGDCIVVLLLAYPVFIFVYFPTSTATWQVIKPIIKPAFR